MSGDGRDIIDAGRGHLLTGPYSAAQPYTKEMQLHRGPKRYRRRVADHKTWEKIIAEKAGCCRVCGCAENGRVESRITFHHVVPRSSPWFGDDVPDNIVPVCLGCHELIERRGDIMLGGRRGVEARKRPIAVELIVSLDDSEYAYAVERGGEAFFERCYGIRYER